MERPPDIANAERPDWLLSKFTALEQPNRRPRTVPGRRALLDKLTDLFYETPRGAFKPDVLARINGIIQRQQFYLFGNETAPPQENGWQSNVSEEVADDGSTDNGDTFPSERIVQTRP